MKNEAAPVQQAYPTLETILQSMMDVNTNKQDDNMDAKGKMRGKNRGRCMMVKLMERM